MKYMLMMHAPRAGWETAGIGTWPPEDIKAHINFMIGFHKELSEAGELVGAEGLALPSEARIVRAGDSGAPVVTDGPYAEAKEFLAGYWIVDVETTERAYELAARASAAPGKGGVPLNMPIEVRQVMSRPPEDF
ncbi:MAG TPA: YciI family protein [Thermoanaerobaculia bacterium]|nr:YciI family protein [Thermoanaerobaculia bacterium]